MYQNTDTLELGKDFFDLNSGKYLFTYIFDGHDRVDLEGENVPDTVKSKYSDSDYDTYGYVKGTGEALDESDVHDICYNHTVVTKDYLDQITSVKNQILEVIKGAGIKEPFIFEGGDVYVGKEHVLSAHINAGYKQGWISSSICW